MPIFVNWSSSWFLLYNLYLYLKVLIYEYYGVEICIIAIGIEIFTSISLLKIYYYFKSYLHVLSWLFYLYSKVVEHLWEMDTYFYFCLLCGYLYCIYITKSNLIVNYSWNRLSHDFVIFALFANELLVIIGM